MNKKKLYESIMRSVSKEVKKALNESYDERLAVAINMVIRKICKYSNLAKSMFTAKECDAAEILGANGLGEWVLDYLENENFDTDFFMAIIPDSRDSWSPFHLGSVTPLYVLKNNVTNEISVMSYCDHAMNTDFLSCITSDGDWEFYEPVKLYQDDNEDHCLYIINVEDFDEFCEKNVEV